MIRGILRRDWRFEGIVVSDYNAVNELVDHGAAVDRTAAGRLAIEAGVDVDMASEVYVRDIAALIRTGQLDERKLDEAVMRVLRAKYRLGLFDDPYRYSDVERERTAGPTRESRAAAREIARKSLVLLKNDGVLPLSKNLRTIAVVGPLANDARSMLGSWSAAGRAEEVVTPLQAVRIAVGRETRVLYTSSEPAQAASYARQADAVLLFLGESHAMSGEARSRSSLDEGGHAIADALFGDANPAGRLPVTFPRTVGQIPIYYNHKNTGRPPSAAVENSCKYLDVAWTALFPFGHGLSYTTFEYEQLRIDRPRVARGEKVDIRVEVANTGKRAGRKSSSYICATTLRA